jgi:hypothetical protein
MNLQSELNEIVGNKSYFSGTKFILRITFLQNLFFSSKFISVKTVFLMFLKIRLPSKIEDPSFEI